MVHNIRILDDITNHCKQPTIEEMLKYDLWEFHEALFVLTSWPDYIIKADCKRYSEIKNISRTFFYEAAPPPPPTPPTSESDSSTFEWRFDPRQMNSEFITAYNSMRDGVAAGLLEPVKVAYLGIKDVYGQWKKVGSGFHFEGEWISSLFSPSEVIDWALANGIYFSKGLQKSIGINLINGDLSKPIRKKIEIKIVGQFLRHWFPSERSCFYSEHELMKEFVEKPEWDASPTKPVKDKFRFIRNHLDELRDPNRISEQGNLSDDDIKNEHYTPRAIKEVVSTDEDGMLRYHKPSLEVAIRKAAQLLIKKHIEESIPNWEVLQSKDSLDRFLEAFMKHEVISLYIKGGSTIERVVYATAYETAMYSFN